MHNHKYQPQHVVVVERSRFFGFSWIMTAIKIRHPSMVSSKWKNQLTLRNSFSYWLAFRKGNRHERLRT
jgi:hypothetical protein